MFDPELFGQAMGEAIKKAVAPLHEKIAALEKQLAERPDFATLVAAEVGKAIAGLPTPRDGKDADPEAVKALVREAVDALPKPQDGKSVTLDDAQPVIKEVTMRLELDAANVRKTIDDALAAVDERMKEIRQPEDGRSVTLDDVRPMLDEAIKQLRADADEAIKEPLKLADAARDALCKAVGELRQPEDGKSVTLADVQPVIDAAIERIEKAAGTAAAKAEEAVARVDTAVAGLRQPADGRSVTVEDIRPLITDAVKTIRDEALDRVELAVKALPAPKDGIGVAGAMIDRDGNLNLTLTNGEVKNLGRVEGKDGVDGISLDAFEMEYLPETHEIALKAVCAGRVKELRYPAGGIRPAGYWRDGSKAKAGDVWTRNGSMWIAKRDTSAGPEPKSEDWYMAVQKGRDGESIVKTVREGPEPPIKLKGGDK